jgi:LysR family hydrogen peroxide-inducible transcriptional activator
MELHQLDYVRAVAKYQNFTRAAEEINVSQSSLSQQVNKLESELEYVCLTEHAKGKAHAGRR